MTTGNTRRSLDLAVGCEFKLSADCATAAVMMVEPHTTEHEVASAAWSATAVDDAGALRAAVHDSPFVDGFGNRCRRFVLPAGRTVIRYAAVAVDDGLVDPSAPAVGDTPASDLPNEVLQYMLPSRYCQSDMLSEQAVGLFGARLPGWQRVQDVVDWTHGSIRFAYGSSSGTTSAVDVVRSGAGVCRDFAHVAIAMCRALNVPARYTFGYLPDIDVTPLPDPMDFCAWMEVYLGEQWWTFDPRNNARRIGRVVIGRGRDAADVAMLTTFGQITLDAMTVTAAPFRHVDGLPPNG